ncbi:MAG: HU family DNA-binding protein [Pseudomonadota bacterium]
MNKADLIEAFEKETKVGKSKAEAIVDIFFTEITEALVNDQRVEIRGFCSFFIKKYKSYIGRNPKTGKEVKVAAKKSPFFKCGLELKERVDHPNVSLGA